MAAAAAASLVVMAATRANKSPDGVSLTVSVSVSVSVDVLAFAIASAAVTPAVASDRLVDDDAVPEATRERTTESGGSAASQACADADTGVRAATETDEAADVG